MYPNVNTNCLRTSKASIEGSFDLGYDANAENDATRSFQRRYNHVRRQHILALANNKAHTTIHFAHDNNAGYDADEESHASDFDPGSTFEHIHLHSDGSFYPDIPTSLPTHNDSPSIWKARRGGPEQLDDDAGYNADDEEDQSSTSPALDIDFASSSIPNNAVLAFVFDSSNVHSSDGGYEADDESANN